MAATVDLNTNVLSILRFGLLTLPIDLVERALDGSSSQTPINLQVTQQVSEGVRVPPSPGPALKGHTCTLVWL